MSSADGYGAAGFRFDFRQHIFLENDLVHSVDVDEELLVASYKIRLILKYLERKTGKKLALRTDYIYSCLARLHSRLHLC